MALMQIKVACASLFQNRAHSIALAQPRCRPSRFQKRATNEHHKSRVMSGNARPKQAFVGGSIRSTAAITPRAGGMTDTDAFAKDQRILWGLREAWTGASEQARV